MIKHDDSAFPEVTTDFKMGKFSELPETYSYGGMNLRTYIATRLLSGLLASEESHPMKILVKYSLDATDELIKQLNKTQETKEGV